jgi:hypothetical protein
MELPKLSTGQIVGGAAAIAGIAGVAAVATVIHRRKKSRKRKTRSNKSTRKKLYRSKKRKLKFGSKAYRKRYLKHGRKKQKKPYTAGKRKDTSHRRIRFTKRGQPYIIKSDGRARFISLKSAKISRRRRGGRY